MLDKDTINSLRAREQLLERDVRVQKAITAKLYLSLMSDVTTDDDSGVPDEDVNTYEDNFEKLLDLQMELKDVRNFLKVD